MIRFSPLSVAYDLDSRRRDNLYIAFMLPLA
jgi:hypothetical protein